MKILQITDDLEGISGVRSYLEDLVEMLPAAGRIGVREKEQRAMLGVLDAQQVERIDEVRPEYIFILPWNLRDEIAAQLEPAREWGAQFVVPIPELDVF